MNSKLASAWIPISSVHPNITSGNPLARFYQTSSATFEDVVLSQGKLGKLLPFFSRLFIPLTAILRTLLLVPQVWLYCVGGALIDVLPGAKTPD